MVDPGHEFYLRKVPGAKGHGIALPQGDDDVPTEPPMGETWEFQVPKMVGFLNLTTLED